MTRLLRTSALVLAFTTASAVAQDDAAQEDAAAAATTRNNAVLEEAPPPQIDPRALEVVRAGTRFLAAQERMQLEWSVSWDVVVRGREKITQLRSGWTLFDRNAGYYTFSDDGPASQEYWFDGSQVTIRLVDKNAYATVPFEGTFEEMVDRLQEEYQVTIPIWEMLTRRPEEELLEGVTHAAYLGITRVDGAEAHHLAFADEWQDWQVWMSADPEAPVALMIVGTDPYTQGWPQWRVQFRWWDLDPEIPQGAFVHVPDADAVKMSWPSAIDELAPGEGQGSGR